MKQEIACLGVLTLFLFTLGCLDSRQGKVCFKDNCFQAELAESPEEWARGLMFREHLGEYEGMLLVLEKERLFSEWMKNMLIPVDVIWLSEGGEVLHIERNLQPCGAGECISITPNVKAKYVLELNAGTADRIGLTVGDKLEIDIG